MDKHMHPIPYNMYIQWLYWHIYLYASATQVFSDYFLKYLYFATGIVHAFAVAINKISLEVCI